MGISWTANCILASGGDPTTHQFRPALQREGVKFKKTTRVVKEEEKRDETHSSKFIT